MLAPIQPKPAKFLTVRMVEEYPNLMPEVRSTITRYLKTMDYIAKKMELETNGRPVF